MNKRHLTATLALGAVASLTLAGCASGNQTEGGSQEGGTESLGTITLGFLPSWTDGLSTAYLLEDQLTKLGYTVEMEELTEAGPLYTGLAQGDVDIYPSAWPELTHASYMEKYGDQIEDLGAYYEGAKLTIAVPEYVDIDSIEDLAGNADRFDGKIIGIEPGAGLTAQTQDSMIPAYELGDEYELVTSSTAAMLAELDSKLAAGENVAVTLWRPHWAYDAYDIKDLADPEGTLGDAESIHTFTRAGFDTDFPEVNEWLSGFRMDSDMLFSLENAMYNTDQQVSDYTDIVRAWMDENQEWVDSLTA